jgi:uncharacterized membrane protein YdjX (TVP38/TMEM64 family)
MRERVVSCPLARSLNRLSERRVECFVIDHVRSLVDAAGPFGPAAFVAAYALLTVALVPGTIPSLAAGALFGPVWGSLLVIAGATVGAVGAFEVARRIGRQRTRRLVGERVLRADAWVQRRGITGVIGLRLLPVVPFNALNYAFGLSSVRRGDHAIGTAVGIVPGSVAFVALGDSISDPGSVGFMASLGAVAVLVTASVVRSRRIARPVSSGG